ncbi:MAG: VWA domain-containing protein [Candidatus Sulfopaludibacter sp.]|nr:VWA domain-containing protein [Candidatus Sulfopaludibacter sp.]
MKWIWVFFISLVWGFAQSADNHRMSLDVLVTDKAGKPVPGLQQQDFTLLDNKKAQKVEGFRAVQGSKSNDPIEVVLLIDSVNTAFTKVAFARDQVEKFLHRDNGELARPVSLAFLTDSGLVFGNPASRDGNAVATEVDQKLLGLRTFSRREGVFADDELLTLSLNAIQQLIQHEISKPGRKLVIWISPGWPLLSGPGMDLQMTQKQKQDIFNSVVGFSEGLQTARITLNDVDPLGMSDAGGFRTFAYEEFLKGVKSPSQVQYGNLALQVLAVQSGGRVLNSGNDVAGEIAQCADDANVFYNLSFALPEEGPAEYHAVEIKMAKKGLTAHARTGYYAR